MYEKDIIQFISATSSQEQLTDLLTLTHTHSLRFSHSSLIIPNFCSHAQLFYVALYLHAFSFFCLEYLTFFLPVENSYLFVLFNYYLSGSLLYQNWLIVLLRSQALFLYLMYYFIWSHLLISLFYSLVKSKVLICMGFWVLSLLISYCALEHAI